jgi:hypothetical protein
MMRSVNGVVARRFRDQHGLVLLVYTWIDIRHDQFRVHRELRTALTRYAQAI